MNGIYKLIDHQRKGDLYTLQLENPTSKFYKNQKLIEQEAEVVASIEAKQANINLNTWDSARTTSASLSLHLSKLPGKEITPKAFLSHLTPSINALHRVPETLITERFSAASIKLSTSYRRTERKPLQMSQWEKNWGKKDYQNKHKVKNRTSKKGGWKPH